jgi:hypothetical protein
LTKGLKTNRRYKAAMPIEKPKLMACRRRVELQAGVQRDDPSDDPSDVVQQNSGWVDHSSVQQAWNLVCNLLLLSAATATQYSIRQQAAGVVQDWCKPSLLS